MEYYHNPVVLMVDDNAQNLKLMGEALHGQGYDLVFLESLADLPARVQQSQANLVILGTLPPPESLADLGSTTVVIVLDKQAPEESQAYVNAGAKDVVTRPFNPSELSHKVRLHLALAAMEQELGELRTVHNRTRLELDQARSDLGKRNKDLELVQSSDALTGVLNRPALRSLLSLELSRFQQHNGKIQLAKFKLLSVYDINHSWSHDAGDQAIIHFARNLRSRLPHGTHLARWSGSSFLAVFLGTSLEAANEICNYLGQCNSSEPFTLALPNGKSAHIPLQVSVALCPALAGDNIHSLVNRIELRGGH